MPLVRKIFITISDVSIPDVTLDKLEQIKPSAEDIQTEFIDILKTVDDQI